MLQPKWDGFRLLVQVDSTGRIRAWSRHGKDLTERVGPLLDAFAPVPAATTFDGELVALAARDGIPAQDFAAVRRAVFNRDRAAQQQLCFVAFDLLELRGADLRALPWRDRDSQLASALPDSLRLHLITSQPATQPGHDAILALGFEGTVLKRPAGGYRPGRGRDWLKHKARYTTTGRLLTAHQNRDGLWETVCEVDGRRVRAFAPQRCHDLIGSEVQIAYSRVDADGALREARIVRANTHERAVGERVSRAAAGHTPGRST